MRPDGLVGRPPDGRPLAAMDVYWYKQASGTQRIPLASNNHHYSLTQCSSSLTPLRYDSAKIQRYNLKLTVVGSKIRCRQGFLDSSAMANLVRGAFGYSVPIGTLYDATADRFIPASILQGELPVDAVSTQSCSKNDISLDYDDSFLNKIGTLEVSLETAASILTGLLLPQGSGVYLYDTPGAEGMLRGALYHKVATVQQRIILASADLRELIDLAPLQAHRATHVVIGIDWGLQSILAITHQLSSNDEGSKVERAFHRDLDRLKATIELIGTNKPQSPGMNQLELRHNFTLYTDALIEEGIILQDASEVCEFIQLIPDHISQEAGGKGWELSYTMFPISMLQYFTTAAGGIEAPLTTISPEYLTKFIRLFDEFAACEEKLKMYHTSLAGHKRHVPDGHVHAVATSVDLLQQSKQWTKKNLSKVLVEVRSGRSDIRSLWKLYNHITSTDKSPSLIAAAAGQESGKLEFVSMALDQGASYIGYNGLDPGAATKNSSSFLFLFSRAAMKDSQAWGDNCALLSELLSQEDPHTLVYIVDCDAPTIGVELEEPRICQYQTGQEVIGDLLDHHKFLAGKCFARYHEPSLDNKSDIQKPVTRRFVKIPCPGLNCDKKQAREWTCSRCLVPIECGFTDNYFYCECGRVPYDAFEFQCNAISHGPGFDTYHPTKLHALCRGLDQSDYLNILILGETGVGKSTFINAFVNYLSYSTLDEAKAAADLEWLIPCSFSIQLMDRENPGQDIEEKHIRVGAREDEADGAKGASATQKTAVYPVTIGSTTYRLIDTPGIGDTRGLSYDKKNMADILDALGSYENLHGILILLKSNNARLNTTFRFCVKELLAHLHRGAVENMTFGFTNTRISNYTPGDTFGPLKALLQEHSEIGLVLSTPTTYCFDSESFRYLAAYKNGISLPNEEDFRRSWENSSKEAHRMLDHFRSKPPHNIKSTLSLNGARELIVDLTKPMAEISQLIRNNIAMLEDRKQELQDTRLTADNLRMKLHLEKTQFKSKQLEEPRTVCQMTSCCEFKDSGKGDGEVVTIYKTHCHPICYLDNIKQDVVADPGLIYCTAFGGENYCTVCEHHWQEHMHVLYELEEMTVQVKDTEIERQLQANADDVTLRMAGIENVGVMMKEYNEEHGQIQEAAARFGLFLQKYAMTPINDATVEYIDMLIQNEEAKINAGQHMGVAVDMNVKRLRSLREDKQAHIELVKTLTGNMQAPQGPADQVLSEQGVETLVHKLYSLPHFGENLKSVKNTITSAHQATYRERPYRVGQSRYRGSGHHTAGGWSHGYGRSGPSYSSVATTRARTPDESHGDRRRDWRWSNLLPSWSRR